MDASCSADSLLFVFGLQRIRRGQGHFADSLAAAEKDGLPADLKARLYELTHGWRLVDGRWTDGSAGDANYGVVGVAYVSFRQSESLIASIIRAALGSS
jgi:hypothetical protein